jgi:CBS domain-containing protein
VKVDQVMTKSVFVVQAEHSLNDAARIMWEHDCGIVPVTNGHGRVVGVVTDRDIAMAAHFEGRDLRGIAVERAMSRGVHTCRPDDDAADAEATLRAARVRRLVVVDDGGQLLGVLSLSDLAREAARTPNARTRRARQAEIGETLAAIGAPRELEAGA